MKNDFVRWIVFSPVSWGVFVFPSLLILIAFTSGVHANYQMTPTNLPETNPPATLTPTPRQFCHIKYLVFVHNSVGGVNVRPTPGLNTTPIRVIRPTDNPQRAIGLDNGWYQLCSITGEYITADERYVVAVTTTPIATLRSTPTRLVTNTPTQRASATATSTPDFDWISVDTDRDGFLEYTLRCETPCVFIVSGDEPDGIIQVSVTEWPTRSPTP